MKANLLLMYYVLCTFIIAVGSNYVMSKFAHATIRLTAGTRAPKAYRVSNRLIAGASGESGFHRSRGQLVPVDALSGPGHVSQSGSVGALSSPKKPWEARRAGALRPYQSEPAAASMAHGARESGGQGHGLLSPPKQSWIGAECTSNFVPASYDPRTRGREGNGEDHRDVMNLQTGARPHPTKGDPRHWPAAHKYPERGIS